MKLNKDKSSKRFHDKNKTTSPVNQQLDPKSKEKNKAKTFNSKPKKKVKEPRKQKAKPKRTHKKPTNNVNKKPMSHKKKINIINASIVAGLLVVSVGTGVACIPNKSKADVSNGLDPKESQSYAENVKQYFLASLLQDTETGMHLNNISFKLDTDIKLKSNSNLPLKNSNMKFSVGIQNADIYVQMPSDGPMFVDAIIPLVFNDTELINIGLVLCNNEAYFDIRHFDENGNNSINIKYKVNVEKDESSRVYYIDEYGNENSKYTKRTELQEFVYQVKNMFSTIIGDKVNEKAEEAGGKPAGGFDIASMLNIDIQALIDGLWAIDVTKDQNGYTCFVDLPIALQGSNVPLVTIPLKLEFSNQYHMRSVLIPSKGEELDLLENLNLGSLTESLPVNIKKLGLKVDITLDGKTPKVAPPKNANEYIKLIDSFGFIKSIAECANSSCFNFDLNLDLDHVINVNPDGTPNQKEKANLSFKGGASFGKKLLASKGKIGNPKDVRASIIFSAKDEATSETYSQSLMAAYKNDQFYLNHDYLKEENKKGVRMRKSTLDDLLSKNVQQLKTSKKLSAFSDTISRVEEMLSGQKDKEIVAGLIRTLDDIKDIGESEAIKNLNETKYGKFITCLISNITVNNDKAELEIDLSSLGLGGKISLLSTKKGAEENNRIISINLKEIQVGDFNFNGSLGITGTETLTDRGDLLLDEDYFEIKRVKNVANQFTDIFNTQKAKFNISAYMVNKYEDIDISGGIKLNVDAALDLKAPLDKGIAAKAKLSRYFFQDGMKNDLRRQDYDFKVDLATKGTTSYDETTHQYKYNNDGQVAFIGFDDYELAKNSTATGFDENSRLTAVTPEKKMYTKVDTVSDIIAIGKNIMNSHDPRLDSIMKMFETTKTETYLSSIIDNKLNTIIKTPVFTGSDFKPNEIGGQDFWYTINKNLLGLDEDVQIKFSFGKDYLKSLQIKTTTQPIDLLGGKQDLGLKITLEDATFETLPWNFTKEYQIAEEQPDEGTDIPVMIARLKAEKDAETSGEESTPEEPKLETVIRADHDPKNYTDFNKLKLLLDYGINTAMFGIDSIDESEGEHRKINNTYHIHFKTDELLSGLVPSIVFDFDINFSEEGIKTYGYFDLPILGAGYPSMISDMLYNSPKSDSPSGVGNLLNGKSTFILGNGQGRKIKTYFAYDSKAKDENGEFIKNGAFYFKRFADYSAKPFSDVRKVTFTDFTNNLSLWGKNYLLNSYLNVKEEGTTGSSSMFDKALIIHDLLGGFTVDENNDYNFNINNLGQILFLLDKAEIKVKTEEIAPEQSYSNDKVNGNYIIDGIDGSVKTSSILGSSYTLSLHLDITNFDGGNYVDTWVGGTGAETNFNNLIHELGDYGWSTTPYGYINSSGEAVSFDTSLTTTLKDTHFTPTVAEGLIERNGKVVSKTGTIIDYK